VSAPIREKKLTTEVSDLLESHSWLTSEQVDLSKPDIETDVLIIGGGGAGCNAALIAMREHGVKSVIATKLRMGDANTMMSQGGMQAAVSRTDSPTRHYLDAIGGGHFENKPELVKALTEDGPAVVKWLEDLGVVWDKEEDGSMKVMHGGGTSRKRHDVLPRLHRRDDHAHPDGRGAQSSRHDRSQGIHAGPWN